MTYQNFTPVTVSEAKRLLLAPYRQINCRNPSQELKNRILLASGLSDPPTFLITPCPDDQIDDPPSESLDSYVFRDERAPYIYEVVGLTYFLTRDEAKKSSFYRFIDSKESLLNKAPSPR